RAGGIVLGTAAAPLLFAGTLLGGTAAADQLNLPAAVGSGQPFEAAYRFEKPLIGSGYLAIEWSDVDGRVVQRRRIPVDLAATAELTFSLDSKRAVTLQNRLTTHLSIDRVEPDGTVAHREHDETKVFIVSPAGDPWSDFQIIMWQRQTQAGYAALKQLGITAGMVEAEHRDEESTYAAGVLEPLLAKNLRWYLENIATDFYSPYHKWSGDRPVNWRFLEVKKRYWENSLDPTALIRDPSLSDHRWIAKVQGRLIRDVDAMKAYRPLYYNLADETGIADLSAFWDFDFSGASLAAMRDWLKERYANLDSLNREWGSAFTDWQQVMPMTTHEALR
ncbi:MAG TPA: beta-galactosidase, partial [Pirellulales bacterium]|nr:beta-galactosidase [Pirellulales bacterium]